MYLLRGLCMPGPSGLTGWPLRTYRSGGNSGFIAQRPSMAPMAHPVRPKVWPGIQDPSKPWSIAEPLCSLRWACPQHSNTISFSAFKSSFPCPETPHPPLGSFHPSSEDKLKALAPGSLQWNGPPLTFKFPELFT